MISKFVLDKPNISKGTCTLQGRSVKLKFDVFLYDGSPALNENEVYWTKEVDGDDDVRISTSDTKCMMNTQDMSLTITAVDMYDAGNYRLNVANPVGKTESGVIVLGNNIKHSI